MQAGQTIGSYRIVRPLGKGGMGAVYEVAHEKLGVHYALKTFTLDHGNVDFMRERFLAEGRVLARLRHPNLVRVFDLDVDAATGTPYFVMDLVTYKDGEPHTLADVEEGGADESTLAQWYRELLDALKYVHAQGIVHRDVKPGNILLSVDRHVLLSDFGVSRFFGEDIRGELDLNRTITSATAGGRLVMGTVAFMAPEIKHGEEATPASDFYALGMVFFRLLTGMWYEPNDTARHLLEGFEYNWDAVLLPLLSASPADRRPHLPRLRDEEGQTAASAVTTVAAACIAEPDAGKPEVKRRGLWIGVAVAVIVAVMLGAGWLWRSGKADANAKDEALDDPFRILESVK
ncbi:MAG: serine/threonine protein kinase [Kiritimatiellae bacterium]|nr:serine/threonine protein kinase [Kiritimatiellia bacterium]